MFCLPQELTLLHHNPSPLNSTLSHFDPVVGHSFIDELLGNRDCHLNKGRRFDSVGCPTCPVLSSEAPLPLSLYLSNCVRRHEGGYVLLLFFLLLPCSPRIMSDYLLYVENSYGLGRIRSITRLLPSRNSHRTMPKIICKSFALRGLTATIRMSPKTRTPFNGPRGRQMNTC